MKGALRLRAHDLLCDAGEHCTQRGSWSCQSQEFADLIIRWTEGADVTKRFDVVDYKGALLASFATRGEAERFIQWGRPHGDGTRIVEAAAA